MKCRHCNANWEEDWEYCPECLRNYGGAVYPEKQTKQELEEIDQLIELIWDAFSNQKLGDGVTIHEADLEGCYLHEQTRLDSRAKDPETDWQEVPDWKIENFFSALSFFDVKGWCFYIPAYMIWTLKNWRTTDSITAEVVIWSFDPDRVRFYLPRFAALSPAQSHAVFRFVKFFCDYSDEEKPRHAMDVYWHQFA